MKLETLAIVAGLLMLSVLVAEFDIYGQTTAGGGVAIIPGVLVGPSGSPGPAGTPQLASPTAIAALPTCTAGTEGQMAQINNQQNTPVWGQTPVATASAGVNCGVFCNGTNWTIYSK